jgi:hypoxanthine phosphoribosyltransferase
MNKFYNGEEVIAICVLKGAVIFAVDLVKHLNMPVKLEFIRLSSYGSSTTSSGKVNAVDIQLPDLNGKNVLIIEDIVDSGKTLSHLVRYLKERGAASVKTCALLDKPERRTVGYNPDYRGKIIPDKFVVGFGLDYNEKYRNLPYVGILKPEVYSE